MAPLSERDAYHRALSEALADNCARCADWCKRGLSSTCPDHDAAILDRMEELMADG